MLQVPNFSMILILAIFFSVMWLLQKFLFRPIVAILQERESEARGASEAFARAQEAFTAAAEKVENEQAPRGVAGRGAETSFRDDRRRQEEEPRDARSRGFGNGCACPKGLR